MATADAKELRFLQEHLLASAYIHGWQYYNTTNPIKGGFLE